MSKVIRVPNWEFLCRKTDHQFNSEIACGLLIFQSKFAIEKRCKAFSIFSVLCALRSNISYFAVGFRSLCFVAFIKMNLSVVFLVFFSHFPFHSMLLFSLRRNACKIVLKLVQFRELRCKFLAILDYSWCVEKKKTWENREMAKEQTEMWVVKNHFVDACFCHNGTATTQIQSPEYISFSLLVLFFLHWLVFLSHAFGLEMQNEMDLSHFSTCAFSLQHRQMRQLALCLLSNSVLFWFHFSCFS